MMLVRVEMKDGRLYKGLKCGSEGGLLYLVNPRSLEEDDSGEMDDGYLERNMGEEIPGEEVRILLVPIADIKEILSAER